MSVPYAAAVEVAWTDASQPLPLADDEVHVWRIAVDAGPVEGQLDADERERAERFRDPALGRRYARAHVARRLLLAAYAGVEPSALAFEHAPCSVCGEAHGKPRLAGPATLSFSLSRRGGLALLAITSGDEVGVDLEDSARGAASVAEVRRAIVAIAEEEALAALPERAERDELVRLWTRKEAALKATGVGLNVDPSRVVVGPPDGGGWRRVAGAEAPGCTVLDLTPGAGYVGALALLGGPRPVRSWTWAAPASAGR